MPKAKYADSRQSPYKRAKYRPGKRFFVLAGVLFAVIAAVVVILVVGGETFFVTRGEMPYFTTQTGIIIRDEKPYRTENYGKAEFIAEEGQLLVKGAPIADVYSWDYNDSVVTSLRSFQEKIMQYQQNDILRKIINRDLESLNVAIAAKSSQIRDVVDGIKTGDLLKLERELRALMDERVRFLRENVQANETLQKLYDSEEVLTSRIADWKRTITADEAGMVSFYFDGSENVLTLENIDKLTVANINDVIAGKGINKGEALQRPLFRLVNPNKWYVLVPSKARISEFENGNAFSIEFGDNKDEVYSGQVVKRKEDAGGEIYQFEFTQNISKLLLSRRVDMNIYCNYIGLQVPSEALKTRGFDRGVEIKTNAGREFVPVHVFIEAEGVAIIEPIDIRSNLREGTEIFR